MPVLLSAYNYNYYYYTIVYYTQQYMEYSNCITLPFLTLINKRQHLTEIARLMGDQDEGLLNTVGKQCSN